MEIRGLVALVNRRWQGESSEPGVLHASAHVRDPPMKQGKGWSESLEWRSSTDRQTSLGQNGDSGCHPPCSWSSGLAPYIHDLPQSAPAIGVLGTEGGECHCVDT